MLTASPYLSFNPIGQADFQYLTLWWEWRAGFFIWTSGLGSLSASAFSHFAGFFFNHPHPAVHARLVALEWTTVHLDVQLPAYFFRIRCLMHSWFYFTWFVMVCSLSLCTFWLLYIINILVRRTGARRWAHSKVIVLLQKFESVHL